MPDLERHFGLVFVQDWIDREVIIVVTRLSCQHGCSLREVGVQQFTELMRCATPSHGKHCHPDQGRSQDKHPRQTPLKGVSLESMRLHDSLLPERTALGIM